MPHREALANAGTRTNAFNPPVRVQDRASRTTASARTDDAIADISMALLADPWCIENLFDITRDIVFFVKDRWLRYVIVNETLAVRCGMRSKTEIIGRTAFDLFPSPLGAVYTEQDRTVVNDGTEIHNCLELHLYEGGTRGWCLTEKSPLRDVCGRVVGVVGLSKDLDHSDTEAGYREIAQASEYIRNHYTGSVRIADLVSLTDLSAARFGRLFKSVFHLTPAQLLTRTRLGAAARALLNSSSSVTDVALACGYTDHSAFTRQFKARIGVTPSEYRKRSDWCQVEHFSVGAQASAHEERSRFAQRSHW